MSIYSSARKFFIMAQSKDRKGFAQIKTSTRTQLNTALLGISFTVFALIVGLRPNLLQDTAISLQLVMAIPFIISSMLARLRLTDSPTERRWDLFAFGGFILAYSFLINSMGILLASLVSITAAMAFFAVNILSALVYSAIEVSYNRKDLLERIVKDGIFIAIVVLLGIIPSLHV